MPVVHLKVATCRDELRRRPEPGEVWMSGKADDVSEGRYQHGPASRISILERLTGEDDEVVVGKRPDGSIIAVERVSNGNLITVPVGEWPYPGTQNPSVGPGM